MRLERPPLRGLLLLLLTGLLAVGCDENADRPSPPEEAPPPPVERVLLIIVDCMRADRLSSYGYERPTTPTIDSVAEDGIRFTRAYAQSNWTKPSVASIFSGRYVRRHGVTIGSTIIHPDGTPEKKTLPLPSGIPLMAESFRAAGFETVGFIENSHIVAAQGFDRGFDHYAYQKPAARHLARWLEDSEGPTFAFLHVIGPHDPYDNDTSSGRKLEFAEYRERFATAESEVDFTALDYKDREDLEPSDIERASQLYDAELAYYDGAHLGPLFEALRESGWYEDALVIVTSDHGEELHENGGWAHGHSLFEEVVRVPLIFKLPASLASRSLGRGVAVDEVVELVDLFPTLLDLAGLAPILQLDGTSLAPLILGRRPVDSEAAAFVEYVRNIPGQILATAVVRDDSKLIRRYDVQHAPELLGFDDPSGVKLYELDGPKESEHPLDRRAFELRGLIPETLGDGSEIHVVLPDVVGLSEEELADLKALGYVS